MVKEQKINKYLSVKLVKNQVYTFINGKRFLKCRHAIMNIPITDAEDFEGFDSIDDIIEYSRKKGYFRGTYPKIDPETDFMVHCSNLQAWVENDYDTRILHSNLSFPLLQEIALHHKRARTRLAEEICFRFFNGNKNIQTFLFKRGLVERAIFYAPLEYARWLNDNYDSDSELLIQIFNYLNKNHTDNPDIHKELDIFKENKIVIEFLAGYLRKFWSLSKSARERFILDNPEKVAHWFEKNLEKRGLHYRLIEIYNIFNTIAESNSKIISLLMKFENIWFNEFRDRLVRFKRIDSFDEVPESPLRCAKWLNEGEINNMKIIVGSFFLNRFRNHPEINKDIQLFFKNNPNLIEIMFRLTGVPPDQAIRTIRINVDITVREIKNIVQTIYGLNPILAVQFILGGKVLPDNMTFKKVLLLWDLDLKKIVVTVMATEAGG